MMIGVRDDDAGDATRIGVDAFDEDIDDVFLRRMSSFAARLRFITARIGRKLVRDSTTMGLKNLNSTRDARGVDCARACVYALRVLACGFADVCMRDIYLSNYSYATHAMRARRQAQVFASSGDAFECASALARARALDLSNTHRVVSFFRHSCSQLCSSVIDARMCSAYIAGKRC